MCSSATHLRHLRCQCAERRQLPHMQKARAAAEQQSALSHVVTRGPESSFRPPCRRLTSNRAGSGNHMPQVPQQSSASGRRRAGTQSNSPGRVGHQPRDGGGVADGLQLNDGVGQVLQPDRERRRVKACAVKDGLRFACRSCPPANCVAVRTQVRGSTVTAVQGPSW